MFFSKKLAAPRSLACWRISGTFTPSVRLLVKLIEVEGG
jgi:hypothetical protein